MIKKTFAQEPTKNELLLIIDIYERYCLREYDGNHWYDENNNLDDSIDYEVFWSNPEWKYWANIELDSDS